MVCTFVLALAIIPHQALSLPQGKEFCVSPLKQTRMILDGLIGFPLFSGW
jgi:hypothetical protein